MARVNQNATIWAGDTVNLDVAVTNSAGAAKDITGATIAYVLFNEPAGATVLTKTTADDIAITPGTGGLFTITLEPADTESVAPGAYYHEAEVTDISGNVATVLTGKVTIMRSRI